jgi:hypothetical protein
VVIAGGEAGARTGGRRKLVIEKNTIKAGPKRRR